MLRMKASGPCSLKTGVKSFEALGLYRKLGFTDCSPFGSYGSDTLSVFMMKQLPDLNRLE